MLPQYFSLLFDFFVLPSCVYSLELFQETNIVLVEEAHVVDLVFEKGDPFKSYPECKSSVFFRIDSAHFEYVWVNHTTAEDFNPS